MKKIAAFVLILLVSCVCGCIDGGYQEEDSLDQPIPTVVPPATPLISTPTLTPSPIITPVPTPELTPTPSPKPTLTPKTTETIEYYFYYPDEVYVEITTPLEKVEKTEEFFDLLDSVQNNFRSAEDNDALWSNIRQTAISNYECIEPGVDVMHWLKVIELDEEAIYFAKESIANYNDALSDLKDAKRIAPSNEYKELCSLYIDLCEKGLSMENNYKKCLENEKWADESYKENYVSQGNRALEKANEFFKTAKYEELEYKELLEELSIKLTEVCGGGNL